MFRFTFNALMWFAILVMLLGFLTHRFAGVDGAPSFEVTVIISLMYLVGKTKWQ